MWDRLGLLLGQLTLVILVVFFISKKHTETPNIKKELYNFGDKVEVINGFYKGAFANIESRVDDKYTHCKTHEYYATIVRNETKTDDYVCHEDLGKLVK